ncbi:hypothetical protein ACLOJK_022765, partial [Asimina triloba]
MTEEPYPRTSILDSKNTKIVSNISDSVSDWKLRVFYARFRAREEPARAWDIPNQWDNALPKVRNVGLEELEHGQRSAFEFLQSNNLKWHLTRGAFVVVQS